MKMHSSNLTDIGCDDIIYLLVQSSQLASLLMDSIKERHQTTPGRMAQLVEHRVHIAGVTGSSPVATTNPKKS